MKKVTVERRAHARFPKTVDLEGKSPDTGATARMVASDLSLGVLYCTSAADYPEMTRLSVRMALPNGDRSNGNVDVEAVVVRRKELNSSSGTPRYELALFFPRLDDVQRERIARFLAEN